MKAASRSAQLRQVDREFKGGAHGDGPQRDGKGLEKALGLSVTLSFLPATGTEIGVSLLVRK